MPQSALNLLSVRLPQLAELDVLLGLSSDPPTFPAQLRRLAFRVESREGAPAQDAARTAFFNHTLAAIGVLPLLKHLALTDALPLGVSLSPLQRLPQLRQLRINGHGSEWSGEQVAVLRSLVDLEYVSFYRVYPALLSRVLVGPHLLRWKELHGHGPLTEPLVQLLVTLPLTKLDANLAMPHIDQFAQLPHLTKLTLDSSDRVPLNHERIFATLGSLVQLRSLQLIDFSHANSLHFTDADLHGALPHLTQLQSLTISRAAQLTTLAFQTRGTLPVTLTQLSLLHFDRRVPVAELQHVLTLTNLHKLELSSVFDKSISEAGELFFKPPMRTRLFPNLKEFAHSWRQLPQAE